LLYKINSYKKHVEKAWLPQVTKCCHNSQPVTPSTSILDDKESFMNINIFRSVQRIRFYS